MEPNYCEKCEGKCMGDGYTDPHESAPPDDFDLLD